MHQTFTRAFLLISAAALAPLPIFSSAVPIGLVSIDVTTPPATAQFDVSNLSGANALPPDFAVITPVSLSSLLLKLTFVGSPPQTLDQSQFMLNTDGLSYTGKDHFDLDSNPITAATLTGTFSATTITLSNGTTVRVSPMFSATIVDASGKLKDQDFAIIDATSTTSATPEPGSLLLISSGVLVLLIFCLIRRERQCPRFGIPQSWRPEPQNSRV